MERWPQRKLFRDQVNAFRKANGLSRPEVAQRLGIDDGSLHSLMYDKSRGYSLDLLKRAAALFGCSLHEWIDDPGGAPPEMAEASELDRFMARTMGSDISKMTPEQKMAAFEAWKAIARGFGVS